jgi:predicted GNAT superfamily acetyltransferase
MRDWRSADEADILRLNTESQSVLSPMNDERFAALRSMCCLLEVAAVDGRVVGFLMGFSDGAGYDSVNYRWFASRLQRFLYIDRVVITPELRGTGLGRRFYTEAERWATEHELCWLAAEVDLQPPNTVSLGFHRRLAFVEVGRQVAGNGKQVSLQVRSISPQGAASDG